MINIFVQCYEDLAARRCVIDPIKYPVSHRFAGSQGLKDWSRLSYRALSSYSSSKSCTGCQQSKDIIRSLKRRILLFRNPTKQVGYPFGQAVFLCCLLVSCVTYFLKYEEYSFMHDTDAFLSAMAFRSSYRLIFSKQCFCIFCRGETFLVTGQTCK